MTADVAAGTATKLLNCRDLVDPKMLLDNSFRREIELFFSSASPQDISDVLEPLAVEEIREVFQATNESTKNAILDATIKHADKLPAETKAMVLLATRKACSLKLQLRAFTGVILGTHGAELTRLKLMYDSMSPWGLHQELFGRFKAHREHMTKVLNHIATEGKRVKAELEASPGHPKRLIKVLSDIDDTFYSSSNDKTYPMHTMYPGILEFYAGVDHVNSFFHSPLGTDHPPLPTPIHMVTSGVPAPDHFNPKTPTAVRAVRPQHAQITFLTARPKLWRNMYIRLTLRHLQSYGLENFNVLPNRLFSTLTMKQKRHGKLRNFALLRQLYPEYSFIFCGDDGEADLCVGEQMLEHHKDVMALVLIHTLAGMTEERKAECRAKGIHLYETYIGAAVDSFEAGLFDAVCTCGAVDYLEPGSGVPLLVDPSQFARGLDANGAASESSAAKQRHRPSCESVQVMRAICLAAIHQNGQIAMPVVSKVVKTGTDAVRSGARSLDVPMTASEDFLEGANRKLKADIAVANRVCGFQPPLKFTPSSLQV